MGKQSQMEKTEKARRNEQNESPRVHEAEARPVATREERRYQVPPVDIYADGDDLVVVADLPGVSKENLDISVDQGVLTIEGRSDYQPPRNPIRQEFGLVNFYRQFQLGETIDAARISADLRHGVLTIRLPKAEEAKPKKIDIKVE